MPQHEAYIQTDTNIRRNMSRMNSKYQQAMNENKSGKTEVVANSARRANITSNRHDGYLRTMVRYIERLVIVLLSDPYGD